MRGQLQIPPGPPLPKGGMGGALSAHALGLALEIPPHPSFSKEGIGRALSAHALDVALQIPSSPPSPEVGTTRADRALPPLKKGGWGGFHAAMTRAPIE
jgi:hypothetical protein